MAGTYSITDLLDLALRERAHALLLESGSPPFLHISGPPRRLDLPPLTYHDVAELFSGITTPQQNDELAKCGDIHFIYSSPRSGRFAVSATSERQHLKINIKPL